MSTETLFYYRVSQNKYTINNYNINNNINVNNDNSPFFSPKVSKAVQK